jgi:hypothetical protein
VEEPAIQITPCGMLALKQITSKLLFRRKTSHELFCSGLRDFFALDIIKIKFGVTYLLTALQ